MSRISIDIDLNDIGTSGQFIARFRSDLGTFRIVSVKLTYPQTWNMSGSDKIFGLPQVNSTKDTSYIQINNAVTGSLLYDLTEESAITRIVPQVSGSTLTALVPHLAPSNQLFRPLYLHNNSPLSPEKIQRVTFQQIDPTTYDYLIITHPLLRKAVGLLSRCSASLC